MSVLMIFFDGWGIGADHPAVNPFVTAPLPTLRQLLGGLPTLGNPSLDSPYATVIPTDATLGVPGLPQSATGQTTIFTGVNAAQAVGQHLGPYPDPTLRTLLGQNNLFQRLVTARRTVAFANAYPPFFFARLARNSARRSATSYAVQAAGVRYRDIDDLRAGEAVSGFVTNDRWIAGGADVPLITPRQAGRNLARLSRAYDLTLFEYFMTDVAGHRGRPAFSTTILAEVDELLLGVLDELDLARTLLVTTSDHGNLEDSSVKGHTLNPVPTILAGAGRASLADGIHSLTDLTPALVDWLTGLNPNPSQ
jgi:hypothetical protein